MELSGLSVNQSQISTDFGSILSDVPAKATPTPKSPKILENPSVRISLPSDLQKLVAELDLARKDKTQDALQSQFAIALAALTAAYEGLTAQQTAALKAVSETSDDVAAANAAVTDAQAALDASSAELAELNEQLEQLVAVNKPPTEDPDADPEDETIGTTGTGISTSKDRAALLGGAAGSVDDTIESLQAKIEEQKKVVAADAQALAEAKTVKAEAEAAFATALSALDSIGVSIVVDVGISTAKMLRAAAAERANPVGVQKANTIIDALGDLAEKLAEMQEEELREEVAKITPTLLAFATVDSLIDPGEFPEYEHRI